MIDKRKLHIISASTLAALLIIFLIPFETAGRIIAAVLIAGVAVVTFVFIKKRSIPSGMLRFLFDFDIDFFQHICYTL